MDEADQDSIGYAFKGKIMISSVIILFFACFFIVLFHVYSRWCRRRPLPLPLHFHIHRHPPPPSTITPQGLDLRAVNSLPTFVYQSEKQDSSTPLECAVCLSEFEDGHRARILPDCKHCFHVDCIDTWLQSHRDCPLCRTRVKGRPVGGPFQRDFTVLSIYQSDGIQLHSPSSSSSSSQEPDTPKPSTGPNLAAGDPGLLNPDPGYRVTRFWL